MKFLESMWAVTRNCYRAHGFLETAKALTIALSVYVLIRVRDKLAGFLRRYGY